MVLIHRMFWQDSSRISLFLLWSNCILLCTSSLLIFLNLFISHCFNVQISRPYKRNRMVKIYTCNHDCLWTICGFNTLFRLPRIYLFSKLCHFSFLTKFYVPNIWTYCIYLFLLQGIKVD